MEKAMTYPLTLKCPALDTCLVDGDDDDDDADGVGAAELAYANKNKERAVQVKRIDRVRKLKTVVHFGKIVYYFICYFQTFLPT